MKTVVALPSTSPLDTSSDDRYTVLFIAGVAFLFFIIRISTVLLYGTSEGTPEYAILIRTEGNWIRLVVLLLLLFITICRIYIYHDDAMRSMSVALCVYILLFLLSILSILWSDDPELSIRRLLPAVIIGFAAFSCGSTLRPRYFLLFVLMSAGLSLLAEIFIEIIYADIHVAEAAYRFSGIFGANPAAELAAIVLISTISWAMRSRDTRAACYAISTVCIICLISTKSRMPIFCLSLLLFVFFAIMLRGRQLIILVVLAVFVASSCTLIFAGDIPIDIVSFATFGREGETRDTIGDLDGRWQLWSFLATYIRERPIVGYGFDGFWNADRIARLSDLNTWGTMVAHSAHVEVALQLGILGSALQILFLMRGLLKYRDGIASVGKTYATHTFIIILFILLVGFTESLTVLNADIFSFVLVATVFHADRTPKRTLRAMACFSPYR